MITDPFAANRPHLPELMAQTQAAQHPALFPVEPSSAPGVGELSTELPAELMIRVLGEAVPQGSMTGVAKRNGRGVDIFPANKKILRPWRDAVNAATKAAATRARWTRLDGAIEVGIVFFVERPKSAPRRRWPHVAPDIDKLARAVLDGLKPFAIRDDARIVHVDAWKVHARDGVPLGARITVRNGVATEERLIHPYRVDLRERPAETAAAGGAS